MFAIVRARVAPPISIVVPLALMRSDVRRALPSRSRARVPALATASVTLATPSECGVPVMPGLTVPPVFVTLPTVPVPARVVPDEIETADVSEPLTITEPTEMVVPPV